MLSISVTLIFLGKLVSSMTLLLDWFWSDGIINHSEQVRVSQNWEKKRAFTCSRDLLKFRASSDNVSCNWCDTLPTAGAGFEGAGCQGSQSVLGNCVGAVEDKLMYQLSVDEGNRPVRETIVDVSSASSSSEQMRGLWVKRGLKGDKEETYLRGDVRIFWLAVVKSIKVAPYSLARRT